MGVTLEEVMNKFDSKIEQTIQRKNFIFDEVEDIKQDIYMNMLRRGYLKKYNPKYALSTYIYTFVLNHCKHIWRDSFAQKRGGRYLTISIDNEIEGRKGTGNRSGTFLKDLIPNKNSILSPIESNDFIISILKEVSKNNIYTINGRKGRINLKKVINLVISGYNVKEASKKLKISPTMVSKRFIKLSNKSWVNQYINS